MPLNETHTRLSVMTPPALLDPEDEDSKTVTRSVDIALSKDLDVAALTGEIVHYLRSDDFKDSADGKGIYAALRKRLDDPHSLWQLATPTGKHYAPNDTITSAGLNDGDRVVLVDSRQRENLRPIIDDTAEAVADGQRMVFAAWASRNSRSLGAVTLPIALAVLATIVVGNVTSEAMGVVGQYVSCAIFAFAAAVLLVGSAMARDAADEPDMERLLAGVITGGYVCLATAGLLIVPGGLSAWSLMLAAALVGCASAVVNAVIRFPESINFAALWLGVLVVIGGALGAITSASGVSVAVGLSVLAVAFMTLTPKLALMISRMPMQYVPAQGETYVSDDGEDLISFDTSTRNDVISSVMNHEQKVVTARQAMTGMVWAALIVLAVCAGVSGALSWQQHPVLIVVFWGLVVVALLFRGKAGQASVDQGSYLIGAYVIGVVYLLSAAFTEVSYVYPLAGAIALVIGTAIGVQSAVQVRLIHSPATTRWLERVEYMCWGSIAVVAAFVLDLFSAGQGVL